MIFVRQSAHGSSQFAVSSSCVSCTTALPSSGMPPPPGSIIYNLYMGWAHHNRISFLPFFRLQYLLFKFCEQAKLAQLNLLEVQTVQLCLYSVGKLLNPICDALAVAQALESVFNEISNLYIHVLDILVLELLGLQLAYLLVLLNNFCLHIEHLLQDIARTRMRQAERVRAVGNRFGRRSLF